MRRFFSPFLLGVSVLIVSAGVAGSAVAGTTTGGTTGTTTPQQPVLVATPDPVLTKLNQIQADLDSAMTKLTAVTAKLDALTVKHNTLKAKIDDIYDITHYTKGYVQGGIPGLQEHLRRTCGVASEARDYAAWNGSPHAYPRIYTCP